MLETAIRKIEAQQPKARNAVWGVGEQLKDILRREPELAELVSQDLDNQALSLEQCERKIKSRADEIHKKEKWNCVCVTPGEAEGIIRKFYGLPERGTSPSPVAAATPSGPGHGLDAAPTRGGKGTEVVNLADFF